MRSRVPPFSDSILAIIRICASPPQVAATSLERCSCKRSRFAWLWPLAQHCQLSSKESENRTADEQDERRWTERKSNRYLCSSSASICVHLRLKILKVTVLGVSPQTVVGASRSESPSKTENLNLATQTWLGKLANLHAAKTPGLGIAPHKPLMIFSLIRRN
jgi:hypothetical protein